MFDEVMTTNEKWGSVATSEDFSKIGQYNDKQICLVHTYLQ